VLIVVPFFLYSVNVLALESASEHLVKAISKKQFSSYQDLNDFIEQSPKVTEMVAPTSDDIENYGADLVKAVTGSDCNRDGKIDDKNVCTATFYKLWFLYKR